jgi:hypothetical protein
MGFYRWLFGWHCGVCGKKVRTVEEVSLVVQQQVSSGNPFRDAVSRSALVLTTPAYSCSKCEAVVCHGCLTDKVCCPKCKSTQVRWHLRPV